MPASESDLAFYVHLYDDAGIFVIDGETGQAARVTASRLRDMLRDCRSTASTILLSLDDPSLLEQLEVTKGEALRDAGFRLRVAPTALPLLDLIFGAGVRVQAAPQHLDVPLPASTTSLMSAAYAGHLDVVQDLAARGADVDARDDSGYSPLMYAANAGRDDIVRALIDAGADVNLADREGSTPLMFAAQHGYLGAVKKLLAAGADADARRIDGLAARDLATRNGHERVAAVLLSAQLR